MTDLEKEARIYMSSLPEDVDPEEKPNNPESTWQRMHDSYWAFMLGQLNTLRKE